LAVSASELLQCWACGPSSTLDKRRYKDHIDLLVLATAAASITARRLASARLLEFVHAAAEDQPAGIHADEEAGRAMAPGELW
jgi:hypothetical protein